MKTQTQPAVSVQEVTPQNFQVVDRKDDGVLLSGHQGVGATVNVTRYDDGSVSEATISVFSHTNGRIHTDTFTVYGTAAVKLWNSFN